MMFGWGESRACPVGVDIGTRAVKLLQLRACRDGYALQAAARVELPPDPGNATVRTDQIVAALKRAMATARFSGTRCVSSLAPGLVHARSVRLPQMPDSDLAQAVGFEAKDRFGFDLTDAGLAYFRAGEVRRGTEIRDELLLFAITAPVLRDHVLALTRAGLRPVAIDVQPAAMMRALTRAGACPPTTAAVDLGQSGTQVLISHRGRLVFYKHIDIGASKLDAAVAQKLGVPVEEAVGIRARLARTDEPLPSHLQQAVTDAVRPLLEELARELDMCVRYYVVTFRGTRPEVTTLLGGQAHCPQVVEALEASLGGQVLPAQILRGVTALSDITRPDRSCEWAVATGLSLYLRESQSEPDSPAAQEVAV